MLFVSTDCKSALSRIVLKIENYIYSSASNYSNGKGIIDVELLEIPKVDVLKPSSFDKYISQY